MARKRAILAGAGQIAYVAGAVVVAYVIVSFASSGTRAAIWVVPLTVLLYFGPIGLAVLAVIAILLGLLLGLGVAGPVNVDFDVVYLVVGILAAIGVAVLNVFLLRRARTTTDSPRGPLGCGRPRDP